MSIKQKYHISFFEWNFSLLCESCPSAKSSLWKPPACWGKARVPEVGFFTGFKTRMLKLWGSNSSSGGCFRRNAQQYIAATWQQLDWSVSSQAEKSTALSWGQPGSTVPARWRGVVFWFGFRVEGWSMLWARWMSLCPCYSLREDSRSRGSRVFIENALSVWILGVGRSWCAKFINRRTSWRSAGGLWYFPKRCGSSAAGGWKDEAGAGVGALGVMPHLQLYQQWSRGVIPAVSCIRFADKSRNPSFLNGKETVN